MLLFEEFHIDERFGSAVVEKVYHLMEPETAPPFRSVHKMVLLCLTMYTR